MNRFFSANTRLYARFQRVVIVLLHNMPLRLRKVYNRLSLWVFCLLLISFSGMAQLQQIAQLEYIKDPKQSQEMDLLPLQDAGALLTFEKNEVFGKSITWDFVRIDSSLKELWKTKFEIPNNFEPSLSFQNKEYLFWLFIEPETVNIQIMRLDLAIGELDEFKGKLLGVVDISHFKVLGNTAFIGGVYFDKPVVLSFSFFNQASKVLHGIYDKHLEVNALEIDEKRNELNVIIKERRNGRCGLGIQSYSYEGKLLRSIHVPTIDNNSLSFISGKMLPISEHESMLVGNYSTNCSEYSKGLYLTRLEDGEEKGTSTITFADLQSFFSYMSPKRQERVREKIEKKKKEGKEPHFTYKLLVHNLEKTPRGFLLVAEVYYPSATSYSSSNYMMVGASLRNKVAKDKALSYRFTHAVVCEFDLKGKILWDNAMIMDNLESKDLVEQIQVSHLGNELVMAYFEKGKVYSQRIHENKLVGEKAIFEIKSDETTNRIDEEATVAAWYKQFFIAWGTRKVEGKRADTPDTELFYLRKLTYSNSSGVVNGQ
ncbi:hypothetical protein [Flectobacillus major]|uniref:hypothetical protein n=1 Tax=Flectobacillus major TaxID=103 RepID=UPI00118345EC|nr:hypothetical protein [Flectobacillus major]